MVELISFAGRVAVVTGAGSGLGKAYAHALAARGARVVVNDIGGAVDGTGRSSAAADAVAREIRDAGGEAIADDHSVAEEDGARAIIRTALDAFGTVDIIINNAGIARQGGFHDISLAHFQNMVAVHLFGAAAVTHAAWPILRQKRYGRVVMTTSSAGLWGLEHSVSYSAAKAGVVGLTKALALEGEAFDIKVNALAPGAKTRMSARAFEGKGGWTWRPELVAPMALYLASEQCGHNGAVFAALAGTFARVETVQATGRRFDPRRDISVEDVVSAIDEICEMEGARALTSGLSSEVTSMAGAPPTKTP